MDIVKMEHVTKIYGSGDTRVWALDDVNLTVQKGESLAVVGASGSGKSTLLHVMGGVDTVTNGKVIVDDRDITTLKDEEMSVFRRRKIGFVFQSYHLIPVLTVEENIQMPILLDHKKPEASAKPVVRRTATARGNRAGTCKPPVSDSCR